MGNTLSCSQSVEDGTGREAGQFQHRRVDLGEICAVVRVTDEILLRRVLLLVLDLRQRLLAQSWLFVLAENEAVHVLAVGAVERVFETL